MEATGESDAAPVVEKDPAAEGAAVKGEAASIQETAEAGRAADTQEDTPTAAVAGVNEMREVGEWPGASGVSRGSSVPFNGDSGEMEATGRTEGEAGGAGGAGLAGGRRLWKVAGTKVRTQVALSMSLMVMRGRTGGKLLDIESGSSQDREALEEMYKGLKVHRDECERLGNYAEATSLGARMHTIRQQQEHNRREEMERNHLADNIKVEMVQLGEIKKLTVEWEERMAEYEDAVRRSEAAMAARHTQQHKELHQRIFGPLEKPKWSTHLLNMRAIHLASAAAQDYERAIEVQVKAEVLQEQEREVMEQEAASRFELATEKLTEKHEKERETFKDRADFGRRKRGRARARDFHNLECRFSNVKAEMKRLQDRESMQLQMAIDSSLGLGKAKSKHDPPPPEVNDGSEHSEERKRPTSTMRAAQHAYDWNVRFGNKAGNASTITQRLNLSAAEKGEEVLARRTRRGKAELASSSPTFPQPHTGGAMPHYLLPAQAPGSQPFRPSSRIDATDARAANTFRVTSASPAAIEIYSRPVTAPGRPSSADRRGVDVDSHRPFTATGDYSSPHASVPVGRPFGTASGARLQRGREHPYSLSTFDGGVVEAPRTFSPPRTSLASSLAAAGLSSHRPAGGSSRSGSPWASPDISSMDLPSLRQLQADGAEGRARVSMSQSSALAPRSPTAHTGIGSRPPGAGGTAGGRKGQYKQSVRKPAFQGNRPVSRHTQARK